MKATNKFFSISIFTPTATLLMLFSASISFAKAREVPAGLQGQTTAFLVLRNDPSLAKNTFEQQLAKTETYAQCLALGVSPATCRAYVNLGIIVM